MCLRVNAARSQPALQSDTPVRTYLTLHPSREGQLNSAHPKQDLNCSLTSAETVWTDPAFFISWDKNPKTCQAQNSPEETSFKDPEGWRANVVGHNVSENRVFLLIYSARNNCKNTRRQIPH